MTDEEFSCIVSKKIHINSVQGILVFQLVSVIIMSVDLDLLMREVVECFVVCHWAVSYVQQVGQETYVKSCHQCYIEVIIDGSSQPRELYGSLIETFSKDGDLIIDIGSMQMVSLLGGGD